MNSIDDEDKLKNIIKYGKYVLLLIIAIVLIFVFKGCEKTYSKVEEDMIAAAKSYVANKNLSVNGEIYIEISKFDLIEGTELCNKGSGVIVTNNNGTLKYQAYLKCPDYTSKIVNNKSKYITLNGEEVVILNAGEIFNDPHYTIKGELINGYVEIRGEVKQTT